MAVNLIDSTDIEITQTGDNIQLNTTVDMQTLESNVSTNTSNISKNATDIENLQTYSTNEVNTGKVWINDKPIYRKIVEFGSFPNNTSKDVATEITNLAKIISLEYTWYDSTDGYYFTNIRFDSNSVFCKVAFKVSNNSLFVQGLGTNWSSRTSQGIAILEYTKTTD